MRNVLVAVLVAIVLLFLNQLHLFQRTQHVDYVIHSPNVQYLPKDTTIHQLISPKHAHDIATRVYQLSNHWERINPVMSVLGTASYIHGRSGNYNYLSTNKLLQSHFPDLLQSVLHFFKQHCDHPVAYKYALPGFHVFDCDGMFQFPVSSVHKDLQYQWLPDNAHLDTHKTMSFTVCIQLPTSGGGLWLFENSKKIEIQYSPGYIVCHNGHATHMIAPSSGNTHRITLQGHSIFDKNTSTWYIYW